MLALYISITSSMNSHSLIKLSIPQMSVMYSYIQSIYYSRTDGCERDRHCSILYPVQIFCFIFIYASIQMSPY